MKALASLALLSLLGAACSSQVGSADDDPEPELSAVVRYLSIEGGCWVLETAQGRLQPVGLPASYLQDELRVRVRVRRLEGQMSTCQVGSAVEVLHVRTVEDAGK